MAALSLFAVYYAGRQSSPQGGHYIGLIAGYALVLNANYIMQVGQPSLDPLAQLLAFSAVLLWLFKRQYFWSGGLLGLAFLTKGLEMLPHLAALLSWALLQNGLPKKSSSTTSSSSQSSLTASQLLQFSMGLLLPIALWLGYDLLNWNGQWLQTYWHRQFTSRFLSSDNIQFVWTWGILPTFLRVYIGELLVLGCGLYFSWQSSKSVSQPLTQWLRSRHPLTLYFFVYVIFNLLAFWLIKKDSSQHLTGVLLFGAVPVASALYRLWSRIQWKSAPVVAVFFFTFSLGYWGWYISGAQKNSDIWSAIKTESRRHPLTPKPLPIVVHNETSEGYGFFYTVQWYFPSHPVYSPEMAQNSLAGQEVLFIADYGDGRLQTRKLRYPADPAPMALELGR